MTARWQARFRAPRVSLPDWAEDAPHRCAVRLRRRPASSSSTPGTGTPASSARSPTGPTARWRPRSSPDGEQIWWFADTDGDEFGVLAHPALRRRPGRRRASPRWARLPGRAGDRPHAGGASAGPPTTAASCGWPGTAQAPRIVLPHPGHRLGRRAVPRRGPAGALALRARRPALPGAAGGRRRRAARRGQPVRPRRPWVVAEKWDGEGTGPARAWASPRCPVTCGCWSATSAAAARSC